MNEDQVTLTVRLPATLKARLAEQAAKNRRSLNSEIVYQLQQNWKSTTEK